MHWDYNNKDCLIQAFKLADSEHLIKLFLADLLTKKELDLCERRLKAAALLLEGAPYSKVEWLTGLSSTTIARISKKLVGHKGGFNEILAKFNPHGRRYFE